MLDAYADDWTQVCSAYEASRKPNAEAIAVMAQENYVEMRSSVRDAKFRLKKELAFELERRYPTLFVPRYSLVMFHHVPYSEALWRGEIQEALLNQLCAAATSIEQIDFNAADRLVHERLGNQDASRV